MSPQLRKEVRSLAPFFFASLLLPLAVLLSGSRAPHLVGQNSDELMGVYFGFIAFMAASTMGCEMTDGTMAMLLSQPVDRGRLWRFKMMLLGAALAVPAISLFVLWPSTGLKDGPLFPLTALFTFGIAPWVTLRSHSLAAVATTLGCVALVSVSVNSLYLSRPAELMALIAIYGGSALAGSVAGYKAFLNWTPGVRPDTFQVFRRAFSVVWLPVSPRSWFRNLLFKELSLHWINLFIAASLLIFAVPAARDNGFIFAYYSIASVCVGAVVVAPEREWNVLPWHLTLPVSRSRQWALKIVVAFAIALMTSALLPWAFTRTSLRGSGWSRFDFNVSVSLLGCTLALLASSRVRGPLRATIFGAGALLCAIMFLNNMVDRSPVRGLYDLVGQANPLWINSWTVGVVGLIGLGLAVRKAFGYFSQDRAEQSSLRVFPGIARIGVLLILVADVRLHAPPNFGLWNEASAPSAIASQEARKHGIPGLAIVAIGDEGTRDLAVSGSLSASDRIPLPSCAMTATMVAVLVERGKLAWNTRVLDVFPDWLDRARPEYRAVTLENVLSEHAGFARYMSSGSPEWADVAGISGSATEQRRQFAQRVLRRQPAAQPQRAWLAGNAGCPVAAAMAERVTGESFEVLMETLLFQPLGIRAELNWPAFLLPEVGIAMTPGDYAKFLQLHLKGLQGTDGILKSATIRRLHAAVDSASLLDRMEHRQGLGWVLQHFEGVPESYIAGSWGDSGNASHNFFFLTSLLPSRGIAVAVFSSASGNAARDACYEALVREMHRYPPNPKGS